MLAGAGLLPACTVNNYGTGPGGPGRPHRSGVVRTYQTDTVYVNGSTISTPPPPPGGTRGGYAGNGPGRPPVQPPVRGGYGQPGGVRTPTGSHPPPRTGGIRPPASGHSTTPGGGTGNPHPPTGSGTTAGPVRTTPVDSPGHSGGAGTGSTTSTGGSTGGSGGTTTGQSPHEYPTGGIKPIPTRANGGATSAPTRTETAVPGPQTGSTPQVDDYATGGIKPIPNTSPNTGSTASSGGTTHAETPQDNYQTGGIKPIPTNAQGPDKVAPQSTEVAYGTGGIKPIPGTQPASQGEGASTPASEGVTAAAMPALMFVKMPCRGTCPSYTATVWPDGRVVYVGQQNVPHLGTYELRLEPATVASIQQQARTLGFAELPGSFASGMTDIPATVLTMYGAGGSPKTVSVEDAAPAEVQALFDYINGTLNQLVASSEFSEERVRPRRTR
jgi:hypothetical protein